jgi:hypothetical protein
MEALDNRNGFEGALGLLGAHLQKGPHEDLDGVDTIVAGLDAMASALARHRAFPAAGGERPPRLDEVLSFIGAPEALITLAAELWELIWMARYTGLSQPQLETAEQKRVALHDELKRYLDNLPAGAEHA